jgi:lipoyl-dependent peroxiredoxin
MKRRSTAIWHGNGTEGNGNLTSTSGVLNKTPYSSALRFKNEDGLAGTNPEELIAAAHSGCYAMALSYGLTAAGYCY